MCEPSKPVQKRVSLVNSLEYYHSDPNIANFHCERHNDVVRESISCESHVGKERQSINCENHIRGCRPASRPKNWNNICNEGRCLGEELMELQTIYNLKVRYLNERSKEVMENEEKLICLSNQLGQTNADLNQLQNDIAEFDQKLAAVEKGVRSIANSQCDDERSPCHGCYTMPDLMLQLECQMSNVKELSLNLKKETQNCMPIKKPNQIHQLFKINDCFQRSLNQVDKQMDILVDQTAVVKQQIVDTKCVIDRSHRKRCRAVPSSINPW